jgi:hypothetical protein
MPKSLFDALHPLLRSAARLRFPKGSGRLAGACACLALIPALAAKGPGRPQVISLLDLGQQATAPGANTAIPGGIAATVDFVDQKHLLVTFPVRRLMKRNAEGQQPGDEDRNVDAVLLELPSGNVVARTTWRLHDAGQYLWSLGHGRFLLRVRDKLSLLAPLLHLSEPEPLKQHPFLTFDRLIVGIIVSAEADLLTVETMDRAAVAAAAQPVFLNASAKPAEPPVRISFFRLDGRPDILTAASAGTIQSQEAIEVPMTTFGYLDASAESARIWDFDYVSHAGKKTALAAFDSTCFPRAKFVSHSEFIAFGCHGAPDKLELGGFNMRGEQMWIQVFSDSFVHPTYAFAPESGRFVLSRALTTAAVAGMTPDPAAETLNAQDIQVIQMESGRQIFHTSITPVQRQAGNFSLAPDGTTLAVVRGPNLELYTLPPLSPKDAAQLKDARAIALDPATGPISLPTRTKTTVETTLAPVAPPKEDAPPPSAAPQQVNVGDAPPEDRRKPPTLYSDDYPRDDK